MEAVEGAATLCNSSTISLNIVNLKIENITNGLVDLAKGIYRQNVERTRPLLLVYDKIWDERYVLEGTG